MDILPGVMAKSTKDFGRTTKCMEKAILSGLTAEGTKGSMQMVKRRGLDSLCGRMGGYTKGSGREGNKMAEEYLSQKTANKGLESGVTAKTSVGSADSSLFLSFTNHPIGKVKHEYLHNHLDTFSNSDRSDCIPEILVFLKLCLLFLHL